MSATLNVAGFYPERWAYMSGFVEDVLRNSWQKGKAEKLPLGILIDLKKLIYLALKGYGAIPQDTTDIALECYNTRHGVELIASEIRLGSKASEYPIVYFLKKLENFLVVLEYSKVPTVTLIPDILRFFEIFFHKLNLLGEYEVEKRKMADFDE